MYLHVSAAPRISKYLSCSFVDGLALLAAKAYAGDSSRELRRMILETNVIMVANHNIRPQDSTCKYLLKYCNRL